MRQAGSRADRSAAVQELLAYAHAETGTGSDGVVKTGEAKRILSRIARKGDNNARIKALESLAKIDRDELAATQQEYADDPAETARAIICALPSLHGPALAVGMWFDAYKQIDNFPFLRQVAPLLANKLPEEWQRWRGSRANPYLDGIASGPLLSPDEIIAALGSAETRPITNGSLIETAGQEEATDATA
jgi:hypothetical protein